MKELKSEFLKPDQTKKLMLLSHELVAVVADKLQVVHKQKYCYV